MLLSCHGSRPRAARCKTTRRPGRHGAGGFWGACSAGCPLAALGADAAQAQATGGATGWAWGLAVLAVVAVLGVGAAAYLLGAARARLRTESELRAARAEARQQAQLLEGWPWQTDALHRARSADAPSGAAQADDGLPMEALLVHPAVQASLRSRRAFTELQVVLDAPQRGSRSWLLRAVPRHDDLGAFSGYTGTARPADEAVAARANEAVVQTLLDLHPGAMLVATNMGSGWQLQRANGAARKQWPQLAEGAALPAALSGLPDAVATAFTTDFTTAFTANFTTDAPPPLRAEGWTLRPGTALPGGLRSLVLAQVLPAAEADTTADTTPNAEQAAAAAAAAAAATAESDSFSFTVSHDLRAPIRVVEGFTRIVKEDYGPLLDRVANDHLDRVLGAAARMNLMIDALLTLARLSKQPLARQPVNLSQLGAYVMDELRRAAPEREADIEIEPGLITQGDPTLLRLVMENLLGNAWKYSARCARAHITLSTVAHDGGKAYVVRDNGAGFDMRASERLFGLFQRLHSASEFAGTGVGLASVKRIVRRHGGNIWAEAEPGRGAAFYFTLAG